MCTCYRGDDPDNGCETCAECTAKYGEAGEVAKNIPFNMPLYQQRVLKEKKELDDKIESLRYYRDSEPFKKVDAAEQKRLIDQLQVMREYSHILAERIINFPSPNET